MLNTQPPGVTLEHTVRIPVKFSDIDAMRRVWHGSYVRYFEDGREAFGRHYRGIGYADIMRSGIMAPVVDLQVKYYAPLGIDDEAVVTTRYVYHRGARLDFTYEVRRGSDEVLCASGCSTQLFIDEQEELMIDIPDYYLAWQRRWGIIPKRE